MRIVCRVPPHQQCFRYTLTDIVKKLCGKDYGSMREKKNKRLGGLNVRLLILSRIVIKPPPPPLKDDSGFRVY